MPTHLVYIHVDQVGVYLILKPQVQILHVAGLDSSFFKLNTVLGADHIE